MSTLDLLSSAIINKTPISFTYPKPGKVLGIRIGNPHAVYKFTTKEGVITTKVHIWQTGGVSDTGESIPDWRNFDINYGSRLANF